ncbi:hypothetical protein VNI00_007132 [Paramarasmius palmivorus]|uniref:Nitroreductase domain-containing protein n=1 Tax=Paramarasmius palmivorus TaxID=297713 RepID=A0AAW0D565_9AGAR
MAIQEPAPIVSGNIESLDTTRTDIQIRVTDAILKGRYSCRYYLPEPVPRHLIEEIIDAARFAPSGNNTQPWEKVYCISGTTKQAIYTDILQADPNKHRSQYHYYPEGGLPIHHAERRQEAGRVYYDSLGIGREDAVARAKAFYGAPVAFVFTIHKNLDKGSWLDVGYFIQSIHVASAARGLASVSQESISQYHEVFRKHLPVSDDEIIAVGFAMGYPDLEKVDRYRAVQPKREVDDIVRFYGFD